MPDTRTTLEHLEGFMDALTLEVVLHILAEICQQKATYLQDVVEDRVDANDYAHAARLFRKLSRRVQV